MPHWSKANTHYKFRYQQGLASKQSQWLNGTRPESHTCEQSSNCTSNCVHSCIRVIVCLPLWDTFPVGGLKASLWCLCPEVEYLWRIWAELCLQYVVTRVVSAKEPLPRVPMNEIPPLVWYSCAQAELERYRHMLCAISPELLVYGVGGSVSVKENFDCRALVGALWSVNCLSWSLFSMRIF